VVLNSYCIFVLVTRFFYIPYIIIHTQFLCGCFLVTMLLSNDLVGVVTSCIVANDVTAF